MGKSSAQQSPDATTTTNTSSSTTTPAGGSPPPPKGGSRSSSRRLTRSAIDWFSKLFGFVEIQDPKLPRDTQFEQVQKQFELDIDNENKVMVSKLNQRRFQIGEFTTPSVEELEYKIQELRNEIENGEKPAPPTTTSKPLLTILQNTDVQDLHRRDWDKPNSVLNNRFQTIQAQSQFNCLEYPNYKNVEPEDGITKYEHDHTQGPQCCLSCPQGTVYRNYFQVVKDGKLVPGFQSSANPVSLQERGQRHNRQIDNLTDVSALLENDKEKFYEVQSGYTFQTIQSLQNFNERLLQRGEPYKEELIQKMRVGVQTDTEVSQNPPVDPKDAKDKKHLVTQVFQSAASVSYSKGKGGNYDQQEEDWAPLQQLILKGQYEATILAGIYNHLTHWNKPGSKSRRVYLTLLGAVQFGNKMDWILSSVNNVLQKHKTLLKKLGMEIYLVYFGNVHHLEQHDLQENCKELYRDDDIGFEF